MNQTEAAQGFAAMGSEARLSVLNCLIRAGEAGLTVGEIGTRTGIAPSTLAHHLKFLAGAEVIRQTRQGRTVGCRADFDQLRDLAGFILTECCVDAPAQPQKNVAEHG
jgi:DNA-binding transcriptional ArsR family regulator